MKPCRIDGHSIMNQERISELISLAKVDDSEVFSQLLSALNHEEKSIIIGASIVLGRLADERAVPFLLRAFLTTDQEIGAAVAWALGQCGSTAAIPFLSKAIEKGFAVANSCEALGNMGDKVVLPLLFESLGSECEDVRVCSAKALGNLAQNCGTAQRDEITKNLMPLFYDKSRKVRICAAVIFERIATRK